MNESDSNMNPGYIPSWNGISNNDGAPNQNNQNNPAGGNNTNGNSSSSSRSKASFPQMVKAINALNKRFDKLLIMLFYAFIAIFNFIILMLGIQIALAVKK